MTTSAHATPDGTQKYAQRFPGRAAEGHFRESQGLVLSSIGIGTYLGPPTDKADQACAACIAESVKRGVNVIDSAINYRFQRSERCIAAAIKHLAEAGYSREEFIICTKGGYLTPDGSMPSDPNDYFYREYIAPRILTPNDIVGGSHCMTPRFLENQLGRSLKNLGVDCIDVYYLHNPESQLGEIPRPDFHERIRDAFTFFESMVNNGKIQFYGMATWNGFRQEARARDAMQLAEIASIAQEIAGDTHHFRFIQIPFNLGMTEALTQGNQTVNGKEKTAMEAASDLGITLVASASLLQGQVTRNLPPFVSEALGLASDAERALQFVRSAPGITTALVGMANPAHVLANTKLVGIPPANIDQFSKLFIRGESA